MNTEQIAARDRAILWLLLETGMCAEELCALRVANVDREHGKVHVEGPGTLQGWVPVGNEALSAVCLYLDQYRPDALTCVERTETAQDHLFLSVTCHLLTPNGLAQLFARLRKRADMTNQNINPSLLRDTFAIRYLHASGQVGIYSPYENCWDMRKVVWSNALCANMSNVSSKDHAPLAHHS